MKILFLTYYWCGNTHHSEYSGYHQLVKYAAINHSCTVVTWGKENIVQIEGRVEVHYVKPFINKDYFFCKRLAISKYASKIENQFDVVHALHDDCAFYQKHPNLISTVHVSPSVENEYSWKSKLFLYLKLFFIERKVFKQSKKIILVSKNLAIGLNKYRHKLVYIPHGINIQFWNSTNQENSQQPPFNIDRPFVLCVGSHGLNKDLLTKAISENSNFLFVLVGVGSLNTNFMNIISLRNISDKDLKLLYGSCILFIRPMNFATANNSVLEALSMSSRIILSTPNGKYDYCVINSVEFSVVEDKDFCSLVKQSIHFQNGSPNKKLNRYTAVNQFSWEVILAMVLEQYEIES